MRTAADSTIARIAGNLLSGAAGVPLGDDLCRAYAERAVRLARAIVAEVHRTAPVTTDEAES